MTDTATKERPILFSCESRWCKTAATRVGVPVEFYVDELNAGRKVCGGCGKSKTRNSDNFGAEGKTFDGMRSRCRECVSRTKKRHYRKNRESERKRQRKYQSENRERLYAYNAQWQRDRNAALRIEMIAALGGKCACCGEDEIVFLDLDHIYNDGAAERRKHGNQVQILLQLKERGWPRERHQLLCCNCNQGKARNGGVCPHKQKESQKNQ